MESLTSQEVRLFRQEFEKELNRLHETHDSNSHWCRMIMPRHKIMQITNHLKGIAPLPPGKQRSWIESRKFRVFNKPSMGLTDTLMEPTKDKLALAESSVFPRFLAIIPKEDIFDTLLQIHLENNHSTLRETLHLVRGKISNVPRYLVHKFILLCPVCCNNGGGPSSAGLPYTPSRRCVIKARRRRKLMDQFQVDVLDLKSNPDGGYSYILHCMDHITGFHWLFPLAEIDPAEVAQNLVWGIFSLFGFPTELISDYGKQFASQVIQQVTKLWPDELDIKNYLEGSSYKGDVTRRNTRNVTRLIDQMAEKRTQQGDTRLKWSEWLPEIQFMLNATVLDVRTGKTPYEKVFRTQPITRVPKAKFSNHKIEKAGSGSDTETTHSDNFHHHHHQQQQQQQLLTEEIVDERDMIEAAAGGGGGVGVRNVVVVDMSGMEQHSAVTNEGYAFATVNPSTQETTYLLPHDLDNGEEGGSYVMTAADQDLFSSHSPPTVAVGNINNRIISTSTTNSSPGAGVHHVSSLQQIQVMQQQHTSSRGNVVISEPPYASNNKLQSLRLDAVEYMDDTKTPIVEEDDGEKWVTLSADGEKLEVAEIKPTIQQVKIAAGGNKGYRIDPFTRKATYVTENKNCAPIIERISAKCVSKMNASSNVSSSVSSFVKPLIPVKTEKTIQFTDVGNNIKNANQLISTKRKLPLKSILSVQRNKVSLQMSGDSVPKQVFKSSFDSPQQSKVRVLNSPYKFQRNKLTTGTAVIDNINSVQKSVSLDNQKFGSVRTNIVSRPHLKIPCARKQTSHFTTFAAPTSISSTHQVNSETIVNEYKSIDLGHETISENGVVVSGGHFNVLSGEGAGQFYTEEGVESSQQNEDNSIKLYKAEEDTIQFYNISDLDELVDS